MHRRAFLSAALSFGLLHRARPASTRGFEDVTARSGVRFRHFAGKTSQKYLPESMGAGVALLDYNNDGLLDIFFVNGAALQDPMPQGAKPDKSGAKCWNRLYRNNGDGTFTDVTDAAGLRGEGYGMGVAVGDFDNDGFADIYVTGLGRNHLYRNMGDGTFTDVTDKAGVAGSGWCTGACFVDYDNDGHLDLVVARYLDWDFSRNIYCGQKEAGLRAYCHPDQFQPARHLLYRNNGDGTFMDTSASSGIGAVPSKGLGIAIEDFNRDGRPDILVANDSFPQQLFRNIFNGNDRDGVFAEIAGDLGMAYDEDGRTFAGMGIDAADYNGDGWPDVFINALALQRYALFRNDRAQSFEYVSGETGVGRFSANHSGWGAKFLDYDNDGSRDLLVAQGHVMDNIELTQPSIRYLEPLLLLRNQGGKFTDVSGQSGEVFRKPLAARGAAFGDLNNDGSLDVVVNCNDGPALILKNNSAGASHWLMIDTQGRRSNRDGIGARIRIKSRSGIEQHAFVSRGGSYISAGDKRAHFGLGSDASPLAVEILWPSGTVQRLANVKCDQMLKVTEP